MTRESLRAKYGDAVVMGVDAELIEGALKDGFTRREDAFYRKDGKNCPLSAVISQGQKSKLRCEAELDSGFKQIIPYVLLEHTGKDLLFATMRIGGDERLLGQISLGLGGHIDEGETIIEAMYRELEEEVGLLKSNILNIAFCGYIYSEASEVDSVHVGMVYRLFTDIETVECLEEDKLFGRFITIDELRELARMGKMESWSELVYKNILT